MEVDGKDLYFHCTAVLMGGFDSLQLHDKVRVESGCGAAGGRWTYRGAVPECDHGPGV